MITPNISVTVAGYATLISKICTMICNYLTEFSIYWRGPAISIVRKELASKTLFMMLEVVLAIF